MLVVCMPNGDYFRQYDCWNVQKNMCVDIFENAQIYEISTLFSFHHWAIWYMDQVSIHMRVEIFEIGQSSWDCQTT